MEKYELVDENGNKTGKILTYDEIYNPKNIPDDHYLQVAGVVIINDENKILLQKRSRFKLSNPGKWGICSGKVNLGETPLIAAIRETLEEINIILKEKELKLLSIYKSKKARYTIYYARKNVDINQCKIQKEELEEIKYFNIEELKDLDNDGFEWIEDLKITKTIDFIT